MSPRTTLYFEVRPNGAGGSHFILTQTGLTDEMIIIRSTSTKGLWQHAA